MRYSTIACLDDLVRNDFWPAKEFIYDLIRVPLFNATGVNLRKSPRRGQKSNLLAGFDSQRFLALLGPRGSATPWETVYHRFPAAAADYLRRHLPTDALVVGYEMTPALRALLSESGTAWVDLRMSPLRFASDLYIGLRTNRPEIYAAAHAHSVAAGDVMAEASLLAARLRYRSRYEPAQGVHDNLCIYLGQTEHDASLLDEGGRFVRVADHAQTIRQLAGVGGMQYKPHPMGGAFAQAERQALEQIVGARVPLCEAETYELLTSEDDVSFVAVSSGALQEAAWFGRPTYALVQPLCVPRFDAGFADDGYQQIASHVFMSEPLWAAVTASTPRPQPLVLPPRANHLRELHNTWWGYASVSVKRSEFQREAYAAAGGRRQAEKLGRVEAELAESKRELAALKADLAQLRGLLQSAPTAIPAPAATAAACRLPRRPLPQAA